MPLNGKRRKAPPKPAGVIKRVMPTSVAPIAFFVRDDADWMTTLPKLPGQIDLSGLSQPAKLIEQFLKQRGASFFADIARGTDLENVAVEKGLWELVTAGLISADGFDNLRSLIDSRRKDGKKSGHAKRFRDRSFGRWTLLHAEHTVEKSKGLTSICRVLLGRYGVVFRDVVQRETNLPPWRELLAVFRQMEDRGEARGGRFVSGFIGEQFALPQAVDSLRAAKNNQGETNIRCLVAPSDPLNLVGTVLPGEKTTGVADHEIVLFS